MEEREAGELVRLKHGMPGRDLYTIISIEGDIAYCSPLHGDLCLSIPLSQLEREHVVRDY